MADIYPGSPIGGQPFFDQNNIVGLVKLEVLPIIQRFNFYLMI